MLFILFIIYIRLVAAVNQNDTSVLYNDIFSNYNKEIRPGFNHSEPLHVTVKFELWQIKEFKELEGSLKTAVVLRLYWADNRIKWNQSQYNGIDSLYVRQKFVWLPELYLGNSQTGVVRIRNDDQMVSYKYNGSAEWHTLNTFDSICEADTINYPFDMQTCHFNFVPFIDDYREIFVETTNPVIILGGSKRNGEWTINSLSGSAVMYGNTSIWLLYTISFYRESGFVLVTLLIPVCLLGFLNIFIFVIPAVSGERIGFGVTLLLAIGVYFSILSDNLPKSAQPDAAKICYKLFSDITMAGVIIICTIISLFFYHKDENSEVPDKIVTFVRFLWRVGCCKDKFYKPRQSKITSDHSEMNGGAMEKSTLSDNESAGLPKQQLNHGVVSLTEINDGAMEKSTSSGSIGLSKQLFNNGVVSWKDFAQALDVIFIILFSLWFISSSVYYILSIVFYIQKQPHVF